MFYLHYSPGSIIYYIAVLVHGFITSKEMIVLLRAALCCRLLNTDWLLSTNTVAINNSSSVCGSGQLCPVRALPAQHWGRGSGNHSAVNSFVDV